MKRSLSLKREALTALDAEELGAVHGGVSRPNTLCVALDASGPVRCTWVPTYCVCPEE